MNIEMSELYSDEKIAELFGLKRRTVAEYIKSGKIRGNRFGNRWYVLGAELLDYFKGEEVEEEGRNDE